MAHLWSGRFDADPDPDVFEFGRSFAFDRRLFEDDVTGSIAWAEALADAGVLTSEELQRISDALLEILREGQRDPAFVAGDDEDVHAFVERLLVERIGETGKRLHTGRSRNEQVSLDLRLYVRRRIPRLQAAMRTLVAALVDQAEGAGAATMPAYTHLRRAQPILVAHFFVAHACALRRDAERLAAARRDADELPLGSGAVSGTTYAIDTQRLAGRLGFTRVVANSLDAASDRDFAAAFLFAAALTLVHLSRLAEDLVLFTTEEFGFFKLADAVATGSSLMPQKKNPDPLELIRGKAGRMIGHLTGCLTMLKGLPSGYNKDLQEDKPFLFDADDTLTGCLLTMGRVVETLTPEYVRTTQASSGLLLATEVVDYLVARGVAFRDAHEIVGRMVQALVQQGRSFEDLPLDEWRTYCDRFDGDITGKLSATAAVEARRTPQSTAPAAVREAIGELRDWVAVGASLSAAGG